MPAQCWGLRDIEWKQTPSIPSCHGCDPERCLPKPVHLSQIPVFGWEKWNVMCSSAVVASQGLITCAFSDAISVTVAFLAAHTSLAVLLCPPTSERCLLLQTGICFFFCLLHHSELCADATWLYLWIVAWMKRCSRFHSKAAGVGMRRT